MPFVELTRSPFSKDKKVVKIHYHSYGQGSPLVLLHSGWGYEVYHFQTQIDLLKDYFEILIPDRSGYGRSTKLDQLPMNFHQLAAEEMMEFLDKLEIDRAMLWGHSDGAVIAAIMGLNYPKRVKGLILEAFHYFRLKSGSKEFFEKMINSPSDFGERVCQALIKDHGEDYWQKLLKIAGKAWLEIIADAQVGDKDFYQQELSKLTCPTIFIHGEKDLRTEVGEMQQVQALLPQAKYHFLTDIGHSPHSSSKASQNCAEIAKQFLVNL
ncbi:MAG: alpha/beta hydrolase [Blastocatellia bacterium]